jgi:hypothetical protein
MLTSHTFLSLVIKKTHSMMVKSERCKEHVNTSGSYLALLRTISTLCRSVYMYMKGDHH